MTIYFYKAWQPFGCFSNFSPHGIEIHGSYWSTVEHFYQAQKFVGSVDAVIIPVIRAAKTPEDAAALGRCSSRRLRLDWDLVKTQVMREAVLKKFLTHSDIREILLSTGNEVLVENSPTDYFWGCGADNTGQNHLGKVLMSVREDLRQLQILTVLSGDYLGEKG
ncbi:NADAR family protein [Anabaena sp. UHCC 0399]|uniref:NADAR family protein n=1 Tax=Anabaena sp. UHCC 0399 TaxID=3110238 RepID=UPI002B217356|nr:NADAR domain-containing protein [Anabaena sp. UHCC 0399]MEA5569096.1 NADAR domain-containing protein [Anabaena sp. UHCC 0399]